MSKKLLSFCLILSVILSACTRATPSIRATDTPLPVFTVTNTTQPTFTLIPSSSTPAIPTSTLTPTQTLPPTPFPTLSATGLHWIASVGHQFVRSDADGRGQEVIKPVPGENDPFLTEWPTRRISPDGQWIAYYTGSVKQKDLTLHLRSIRGDQDLIISRVVPENYPDIFLPLAKELYAKQSAQSIYSVEGWMDQLQQTFRASCFVWSPDSKYIAFASLVDGPSSDAYLYDLQAGRIKRLSADAENVEYLEWSTDGKWLLLTNEKATEYGNPSLSYYSIDPSGLKYSWPRPLILNTNAYTGEWIGDHSIIMIHHGDGGPAFTLHLSNLDTGLTLTPWEDLLNGQAVDPDNQIILITDWETGNRQSDGLFFVSYQGIKQQISQRPLLNLAFRGGLKNRFIGRDEENVYFITSEGDILPFLQARHNAQMSVAPDYTWLIVYSGLTLELFDRDDQLVRTIDLGGDVKMVWRPDSAGFFFTDTGKLYYAAAPNFEPVVVPLIVDRYPNLSDVVWDR